MKKKTIFILILLALVSVFYLLMLDNSDKWADTDGEFAGAWWSGPVADNGGISGLSGIVVSKECTESPQGERLYTVTMLTSSDTFETWADRLDFIPSLEAIRAGSSRKTYGNKRDSAKKPCISPQLEVFPCGQGNYVSLREGGYYDIKTLTESRSRFGFWYTRTTKLTHIVRNHGSMLESPDGLITWLYRDLPEE